MQFFIEHSPVFTTLRLQLEKGESFKAEAGAMISMSPTISLEAKMSNKSVFGALKAVVGGESFFGTVFTAEGGAGELVLGPGSPGDILQMQLNNQTIFAQAGAYLAGGTDLVLSAQGSAKALMSGEGLFLSKISGTGLLFLNSYGSIYTKELRQDETYVVDTGHIVAFEETVSYKIQKAAKGIFSTLASGEGLVCEYKGPGKIWIQTRNISALAKLLAPFIVKS
ncbi:MAG: TIGR00266 family protein [Bacteroidota bacterium]